LKEASRLKGMKHDFSLSIPSLYFEFPGVFRFEGNRNFFKFNILMSVVMVSVCFPV